MQDVLLSIQMIILLDSREMKKCRKKKGKGYLRERKHKMDYRQGFAKYLTIMRQFYVTQTFWAWRFYASALKENPPAPQNKSINFKKYIFAKEVHDKVDFQQQD